MTILIWAIFLIIFFTSAILLLLNLLGRIKTSEFFEILANGIKASLTNSGFTSRRLRYPVELYEWDLSEECLECEDCLDRATWEPMDIADWMKYGLPGTPEAETECGTHCECELTLVRKTVIRNP